jgi:hypothetical protein
MRTRAKLITTIAAGMLAAVGMSAPAVAGTVPADRPEAQTTTSDVAINNVWVTTWTGANVRSCASTNCRIVYSVDANTRLSAQCWTHGQWVNQNGVAHDKWVRLASGQTWIWGGLLKGNETGGVSTRC